MHGMVEADIPVAPLVDAGAALRPAVGADAEAAGDRGRDRAAAGRAGGGADAPARPAPTSPRKRWVWEQYDSTVGGRHRAAARRGRCRGGAAARHRQGAGAHHRLHAALLPRRPRGRRRPGGGRGLAQPDRRRRAAAGDHRQHELRQPREAARSWASSSAASRHGGRLPGARLPGRVRQCLALQRDRRAKASCRPRRSAASACIDDARAPCPARLRGRRRRHLS